MCLHIKTFYRLKRLALYAADLGLMPDVPPSPPSTACSDSWMQRARDTPWVPLGVAQKKKKRKRFPYVDFLITCKYFIHDYSWQCWERSLVLHSGITGRAWGTLLRHMKPYPFCSLQLLLPIAPDRFSNSFRLLTHFFRHFWVLVSLSPTWGKSY